MSRSNTAKLTRDMVRLDSNAKAATDSSDDTWFTWCTCHDQIDTCEMDCLERVSNNPYEDSRENLEAELNDLMKHEEQNDALLGALSTTADISGEKHGSGSGCRIQGQRVEWSEESLTRSTVHSGSDRIEAEGQTKEALEQGGSAALVSISAFSASGSTALLGESETAYLRTNAMFHELYRSQFRVWLDVWLLKSPCRQTDTEPQSEKPKGCTTSLNFNGVSEAQATNANQVLGPSGALDPSLVRLDKYLDYYAPPGHSGTTMPQLRPRAAVAELASIDPDYNHDDRALRQRRPGELPA
ncbi:hypothetical protein PCL_12030 [Purpureocillium lilacinum]|uniref:Uncharacterized protein n=1 Tax=Purpureocillium lilacinum TaxID=33203 RepID=A0A2U3DPN3_PURLI|nr:hypothetical protein PCL_12030 [Purpureocillium lilacinum]